MGATQISEQSALSNAEVRNDRDNNFDFLRFVFAFSVAVYHLQYLTGNKSLSWISTYFSGEVAVRGFFIISGFLITMSYQKSRSLARYWKNRLNRLVPAYVFVVLFSTVFLSCLSELDVLAYFTSSTFWKYLAANLSFLNFLQPDLPGVFAANPMLAAVNGSLWTIKIELAFYVFAPVLCYAYTLLGRRNGNLLLGGVFLFSIAFRSLGNWVFSVTGDELFLKIGHQLPGFLDYFAVGMLMYFNLVHVVRWLKFLPFVGVSLLLLDGLSGNEYTLALGLACLVATVAFGTKALRNFGKFGDFSYGLYLWHFPIIQTLVSIGFLGTEIGLSYLAALVAVLLVAVASWYFVEKPFLKRKSNHAVRT